MDLSERSGPLAAYGTLAHLKIYEGTDADDATPIEGVEPGIESTHIPHVGEILFLANNHWRVVAVRYMWAAPGSQSYDAGDRAPFVDVRVVPGPEDFWVTMPGSVTG